jgi:hypothetical protein
MTRIPKPTIPVISEYRVNRGAVRNRYTAEYSCPFNECGSTLNSSEEEIGETEHCPNCGTVFSLDRQPLALQKKRDEDDKEAGRERQRRAKSEKRQKKKASDEVRQNARLQRDERKNADRERRARELAVRKREDEHQKNKEKASPPTVGKRGIRAGIGLLLLLVLFYFGFGFFVVQPIGAIPDGVTIFYFRLGTKLPFVGSPDGLLIAKDQPVSLLGRVVVLAAVAETIADRRILNLPYLKPLYLWSTGWQEFER